MRNQRTGAAIGIRQIGSRTTVSRPRPGFAGSARLILAPAPADGGKLAEFGRDFNRAMGSRALSPTPLCRTRPLCMMRISRAHDRPWLAAGPPTAERPGRSPVR
jgi:hypothetical protein